MTAVPWDLWPLLAFALTIGWLWRWGRRHDALQVSQRQQRRRHVMQRLARTRNHHHGGGQA